MIEAHIITLTSNPRSVAAAERCKKSTDLPIKTFEAVTEGYAEKMLRDLRLQWNYPWKGEEHDMKAGLRKSAYQTANPLRRVACFLSHYLLWKRCAEQDEPLIVLEHDAIFIKPFDETAFMKAECDIISLNDPRGATRKSMDYHEKIQQRPQEVQPVPRIDKPEVPQGLAGNSAYIIKPSGARKMIKLVKEFGAWPNDAIMCYQLIQGLGVTKTYYTKVQGTQSTTSS